MMRKKSLGRYRTMLLREFPSKIVASRAATDFQAARYSK